MKNILTHKLLLVSLLLVLLQLPTYRIRTLIEERMSLRRNAEFTLQKRIASEKVVESPWIRTGTENSLKVLPQDSNTAVNLNVEYRKKGFFTFPIFKAKIDMKMKFLASDFDLTNNANSLVIPGVFSESTSTDFEILCNGTPTSTMLATSDNGVFIVPLVGCAPVDGVYEFAIKHIAIGSRTLSIVPSSNGGTVTLDSDSSNISLDGTYSARSVSTDSNGMKAEWKIMKHPVRQGASSITLSLLTPIDDYLVSSRAVNHSFLLLVIIFAMVFVVESIKGLSLHPINYLLLGVAISLFYLLSFAFAEHIGFSAAYAISSCIIIGMNSLYLRALAGTLPALILAALSSFFHAFFFSLLLEKNYALLFGTIGITALLGITMLLTRKIDWYALTTQKEVKEARE